MNLETDPDPFADFDFGLDDDPPEPARPDPPRSDDLVPIAGLADWLSIGTSRIGELARDGVLPRVVTLGGHRYPVKSCVQAYVTHLRETAAAARKIDPDLAAAKLALTEANAVKVELQNAKAKGELLAAGEVRAVWAGIAADLRSRLLALPKRMALDRAATARIDRELRAALEDLADGTAMTAAYMANTPDSGPTAVDSPISGVSLAENETAPVGGSYAV